MPDDLPLHHLIELTDKVGRLTSSIEVMERDRKEADTSIKKIEACVSDLTTRMRSIADNDHKDHHEFIKAMVDEKRQQQAMRAKIFEKIATGGIVALASGILGLIWLGFKTKFGIGE